MSDSFCLWAPWVFSALSALAAYLLTDWFFRKKTNDLNEVIKSKESDLYHLNQAHTLLKNDREKRFASLEVDLEVKEKAIKQLSEELARSEQSNKNLLSTVVNQKKDTTKKTEKISPEDQEVAASEEQPKSNENVPEKAASSRSQGIATFDTSVMGVAYTNRDPSSEKKIKKLKSKLKKSQKEAISLKKELAKLSKKKEVIVTQEIPITTIKTVRIKEKIDRKKLLEKLSELTYLKNEKKVKKKSRRGTPKIVTK